jgi:hypothetical protein
VERAALPSPVTAALRGLAMAATDRQR